jgi:2-keto-3-deoxy-L-rhamnonate aldolase RhmA
MPAPTNRLKRALQAGETQIGIWSSLASHITVEIIAGAGFDWVLLDTEHAPNELTMVHRQLQAVAAAGQQAASAVVRPAWNDAVIFKRLLDVGVQSFLVPYVQTAEEAERAVAATRYPPEGVRGVAVNTRASLYGRAKDYYRSTHEEICLFLQIETHTALDNLEAIAAVDGVDAVFIGPADLAASMGHLGNTQHPEVQAAIDAGFAKLKAMGKPAGYLTNNEAEARRRVAQGLDFVGVANDTTIVVRGSRDLLSAVGAPRA